MLPESDFVSLTERVLGFFREMVGTVDRAKSLSSKTITSGESVGFSPNSCSYIHITLLSK